MYRKGIRFTGNIIEYNRESMYSKRQKMKTVKRELAIVCKQCVSVLITNFFYFSEPFYSYLLSSII
jgi:hypothetical protein